MKIEESNHIILKIYKIIFFIFLISLLFSCTTYSKYAQYNSISKNMEVYTGDSPDKYEGNRFNGNYNRYTNDSVGVSMLVMGIYVHVFAHDKKKYKKIVKSKEVIGLVPFPSRNKLLYAFTTHNDSQKFKAFIDISMTKKKHYPSGYYAKTLECIENKEVTLTISGRDKNTAQFLMDNFKCNK